MNSKTRRRLGTLIGLVGVVSVVAASTIVSNQLSNDVIAALAGVMCGIGAAIPISLLIIAIGRWRTTRKNRTIGRNNFDEYGHSRTL